MAVHVGALPQEVLGFVAEHIHGDIDHNGAGAAGLCQTECLVQNVGQAFRIVNAPNALGNGLKQAVLGGIAVHDHFLMGMAAKVVAGHIAADHHHGNAVQAGVGNAGQGVGEAGSQMAHQHGSLVRQAGVAIGCMGSDLLVAGRNKLQLGGAAHAVQQADHGVAAQAEYILNAAALEIVNNAVRNEFLVLRHFEDPSFPDCFFVAKILSRAAACFGSYQHFSKSCRPFSGPAISLLVFTISVFLQKV